MNQSFDIFNRAERPSITLCNPDKTELFSLDYAYNFSVKYRYNTLSEISFTMPQESNGLVSESYDYLVVKRLVLVGGVGYFNIVETPEDMDGISNVKNVTCKSFEEKTSRKRLNGFGGTLKFYDPISPEETLMGRVIEFIPSWSLGSIDASLWNKYRTFDAVDTNIYSFLMNDVSTAYECIFEFDIENSLVNAYSVDSAVSETDIYISFDNLMKSASLRDIDEEITTCLFVYGSGNLDIRTVNPLGGSAIYNFDYYKTTDWMEQTLINAIDAWEVQVSASQTVYADTLTDLKTANGELIVLESELVDLNNEYLALKGVQKVRIEGNLDLGNINTQLDTKQSEIDSKEIQVSSKESTISSLTLTLTTINTSLSFENNFTASQIVDLSEFTFENTYQNENFVQTDAMTTVEIQELSQELYDQASNVLVKLSQPRYTFDIESANFVFLKEFEEFKNQLELGSSITVELPNGNTTTANVLEINLNYDNPDDFSLSLSNRLRLDNESFAFSDLFGQVVKTGASVSFDKVNWANWETTYKNDVTGFITSSLDASVNNVINAENQEIVIDQNGLVGKQFDIVSETYSDEQVWLTSSVLAFTNDGWQTARAALGKTEVDGVEQYGLVADFIVGRLLAGNELVIENEGGTFRLDGDGATLTNASFTLVTDNNKNRILLDPSNGIKIQSNVGGTWNDKFYVDSSGNVIFAGDLSGATGTFSGSINASSGEIGGWSILSDGIYDTHGNYIKSSGNIKLGGLRIDGSTATFSGTIYADKLSGQIINAQVATGLNAGKVTTGSMAGNRIYGGSIGGSSGSIGLDGNNMLFQVDAFSVESDGAVGISSGSVASISSSSIINMSTGTFNIFSSAFKVNGNTGATNTVFVGGVYGAKRLYFNYGIFTGYSFV